MSHSMSRVFVHLVWSTKHRAPMIDESLDRPLRELFVSRSAKMGAELLEFGAFDDHVHLALRIPLSRSISDLVCAFKSESAVVLGRSIATAFRWQTGYGAFSVDSDNLDPVLRYVASQRQHHSHGTTHALWEQIARDDELIG